LQVAFLDPRLMTLLFRLPSLLQTIIFPLVNHFLNDAPCLLSMSSVRFQGPRFLCVFKNQRRCKSCQMEVSFSCPFSIYIFSGRCFDVLSLCQGIPRTISLKCQIRFFALFRKQVRRCLPALLSTESCFCFLYYVSLPPPLAWRSFFSLVCFFPLIFLCALLSLLHLLCFF